MAVPITVASASLWRRVGRTTGLVSSVAYATIVAAVALYAFSNRLTWLTLAAIVAASLVLVLVPIPTRDLQGWLGSLGVQFDQPWVPNWRPALADILFVPLALGTFLWWWRAGRPIPRTRLLPWMLALAVAVCGTGTIMVAWQLGHVPYRTLLNKDLGLLLLIANCLCLLLLMNTREQLVTGLRALLLGGLVLEIIAILSYPAWWIFGIPSEFTWESDGFRMVGLLLNPTAYGGFTMVLLFLLVAVSLGDLQVLPRRVTWGGIGLLFLGLLLTFSRSSWFASLIGIAVFLLVEYSIVRRKALLQVEFWSLVGMALVLVLLLLRPSMDAVSANIWSDAATDPVAQFRIAANLDPNKRPPGALLPPTSSAQPLRLPEPPESTAAAPASVDPASGVLAPGSAEGQEPPLTPLDNLPQPQVSATPRSSSEDALYVANAYLNNDAGIRARLALNNYALGLVLANPINVLGGIGVGTFFERSRAVLGYDIIIHNTYVWLFVETGILGLVAFLGLLAVVLRHLWRVVRKPGEYQALAIGMLAALAAMMVWMLANEGLYQRHFWVLIALADVLRHPAPEAEAVRGPARAGAPGNAPGPA